MLNTVLISDFRIYEINHHLRSDMRMYRIYRYVPYFLLLSTPLIFCSCVSKKKYAAVLAMRERKERQLQVLTQQQSIRTAELRLLRDSVEHLKKIKP